MVAGIVDRAVIKINETTPDNFTVDDIVAAIFAESIALLNERNGTQDTIEFLSTYVDEMRKLIIAKQMKKH